MANQRVLLLVHPYFRPDRPGLVRSKSEAHVWRGLKRLGLDCRVSAVQEKIEDLDSDLTDFRPHVVFNLLEEFRNEGVFDFHLVSYLEARGIPYTGCNPRGLIISRNKIWTMRLCEGAGIPIPKTFGEGQADASLSYPLIAKFNNEHASLGLTKKNLVRSPKALVSRVRQLKNLYHGELVFQEFIPGREYSVSVWGNARPQAMHPWELYLGSPMGIATEKIKFSVKQQRKNWILARKFRGDAKLVNRLKTSACRAYKELKLSGYARLDFRVRESGEHYLIDANANPNLARNEDFALSTKDAGYTYEDVLSHIVKLAKDYRPAT